MDGAETLIVVSDVYVSNGWYLNLYDFVKKNKNKFMLRHTN